jgi:RHS repeat-associated protein
VVRGYSYDAAGNVVAEARTGGGTYSYTYNAAGRMETFSINGFLQSQYKYDAMGRQAIRTLPSPTPVTIHSIFDSQGRRIAEYDETSGTLIREYVWNGWEPVAVIEGGQVYFIRTDHIGRPVFATDASGVKVWSATYLPFGGVHVSNGNLPANRFPGQWFQSESGLHQNWMRDYDPTTGRYLQADPLGLIDGASVYGYVGQNPILTMDPYGLTSIPLPGGPAGAGRLAMFCFSGVPQLGICAAGALVIVWLADQCWDYIWANTPGPGHNGGPPLGDSDPSPNPGQGAGPNPGPGQGPGGAAEAAAAAAGAAAIADRTIRTRPDPGSDGATSTHIIESMNGDTTSVTHQVTDTNGNVIHQHQTHVGKNGSERRFPDSWIQYPEIP